MEKRHQKISAGPWTWLLTLLVLAVIAGAAVLAIKPELLFSGSARLLHRVSITPPEAAAVGAQWRLVTQWRASGEQKKDDVLYLVEFKTIPGWLTPAPVALRKGESNVEVKGVYSPVAYEEQVILTLAGSSTIANRLAPELARFYLEHIGANEVRRLPGKNAGEVAVQGIFYSTREIRTIQIHGSGTGPGFADLNRGTCDVAMAADDAPGSSVKIVGYKVAMDAVAVVVHRANPIQALTLDAVRDIFSGKISNWKDVGGPAEPIKVFALHSDQGTRSYFEKVFLSGRKLTAEAKIVDPRNQLSDLVAQDPWSIGFCSIALADQCREMALKKTDAAEPVMPSPGAIRDMSYPAFRPLSLYHRADTHNVYARDFILMSRSAAGQALVRKFGFVDAIREDEQSHADFVPVEFAGVEAEDILAENSTNSSQNSTNATDNAERAIDEPLPSLVQYDGEAVPDEARKKVLRDYRTAVHGAEKLPMVFRFEPGSAKLDRDSSLEVGRLCQMMGADNQAGKKLVLVGFSDSVGSYGSNLAMARKRAEITAQILNDKGVRDIVVVAVGEEEGLESNDSRTGRERNRRVEAWLK